MKTISKYVKLLNNPRFLSLKTNFSSYGPRLQKITILDCTESSHAIQYSFKRIISPHASMEKLVCKGQRTKIIQGENNSVYSAWRQPPPLCDALHFIINVYFVLLLIPAFDLINGSKLWFFKSHIFSQQMVVERTPMNFLHILKCSN